jgi:hypothetical protein
MKTYLHFSSILSNIYQGESQREMKHILYSVHILLKSYSSEVMGPEKIFWSDLVSI